MSAFGGKADIGAAVANLPLMTKMQDIEGCESKIGSPATEAITN
jgi:hypothetical protein